MSVQYNNPPLREAICELRFVLNKNLSEEEINKFYLKIESLFPIKAKGHNLFIKSGPKDDNQDEILVEQKMEEFERFLNEDTKTNVHLTSNGVVSIHKFEPYESWQKFYPVVHQIYKDFFETFKPSSIERLGLRYVNEINLSNENFKLEDYFNYNLKFPIENEIASQQLNLIFLTSNDNDRISVRIAEVLQNVKDNKKFILDLDYFSIRIAEHDLAAIFKWIDNAHKEIENYFESIISEKTKATFN